MRYSAGGRTAATAATADNIGGELWNPASNKGIRIFVINWTKQGAATADSPGIVRVTTKGTSTLTVTPDLDNSYDRDATPPSAATLELTFSAQPTIAGPYIMRTNLAAALGTGFTWVFSGDGLLVPAGTGIAVGTPVATVLQAGDVTFEWGE